MVFRTVDKKTVEGFVAEKITLFHQSRLASLNKLKLSNVLKRKNPYLFKAKNILTAADLVRSILDAYLSSQEETLFGEFLEKLAIFVCEKSKGGRKSGIEGIDLEFDENGARYIVSIKSGPNWGNHAQIKKMVDNFKTAAKSLRTQNKGQHIVAVNGCCYGRNNAEDKGDYQKLCGQDFWSFISGQKSFYLDMIEPLGHRAREKNDEFAESYAGVVNLFTAEFSAGFCDGAGRIDWNRLVEFNSSSRSKS